MERIRRYSLSYHGKAMYLQFLLLLLLDCQTYTNVDKAFNITIRSMYLHCELGLFPLLCLLTPWTPTVALQPEGRDP